MQLRIWSRKEIENFLLVPGAVSRYIESQDKGVTCSPDRVMAEIDKVVEDLRQDPIEDSIVDVLYSRDKRAGTKKAIKSCREYVAQLWPDQQQRWALAPGKTVISRLSRWSKKEFGVSFGPEQIARALLSEEVDREVIEVISAISEARALRPPFSMPRSSS